jgi:hypothetical protein
MLKNDDCFSISIGALSAYPSSKKAFMAVLQGVAAERWGYERNNTNFLVSAACVAVCGGRFASAYGLESAAICPSSTTV